MKYSILLVLSLVGIALAFPQMKKDEKKPMPAGVVLTTDPKAQTAAQDRKDIGKGIGKMFGFGGGGPEIIIIPAPCCGQGGYGGGGGFGGGAGGPGGPGGPGGFGR